MSVNPVIRYTETHTPRRTSISETLHAYTPEIRTPPLPASPVEPASPPPLIRAPVPIRHPLDDSVSYEIPSPITYDPDLDTRNRHLYFGDEGEEISQEEFIAQNWLFYTPSQRHGFTLRRPISLLHYLRFIDSLGEEAPRIPLRLAREMMRHPSIVHPPPEFLNEAQELAWRLDNHTQY